MSTLGWRTILRRRWIWTFLFVLVVSASMVGPTRAFGGLISRSLDAVYILRDLISARTASRSGESPDPAERSSSEVTRRAADSSGWIVVTPGTPPEDETVADLLPSEDPIESSSTSSSLRQESDLSPLASGLFWPRHPAAGAQALENLPTAVGDVAAAGTGSANAISAQSTAANRPLSPPFEAGVLDEIILQDIALSTGGVRSPSSTDSTGGTTGGTTDAGGRPVEGQPPGSDSGSDSGSGSGEPPPVVAPPTRVPSLLPPVAPPTDTPSGDLAPPEIPVYPSGPPVDGVTNAPHSSPVTVVPEPAPLLLFLGAVASWTCRRRLRAASTDRSRR